jgi:hypothetical protein
LWRRNFLNGGATEKKSATYLTRQLFTKEYRKETSPGGERAQRKLTSHYSSMVLIRRKKTAGITSCDSRRVKTNEV